MGGQIGCRRRRLLATVIGEVEAREISVHESGRVVDLAVTNQVDKHREHCGCFSAKRPWYGVGAPAKVWRAVVRRPNKPEPSSIGQAGRTLPHAVFTLDPPEVWFSRETVEKRP